MTSENSLKLGLLYGHKIFDKIHQIGWKMSSGKDIQSFNLLNSSLLIGDKGRFNIRSVNLLEGKTNCTGSGWGWIQSSKSLEGVYSRLVLCILSADKHHRSISKSQTFSNFQKCHVIILLSD